MPATTTVRESGPGDSRPRKGGVVLVALWALVSVLTILYVYAFWVGDGIYILGYKGILLLWSIPVLPLFVATWIWIARRTRKRQWLAWALVIVWLATLLAPQAEQPYVAFDGSVSQTVVPAGFSVSLYALTFVVLATSFGMLSAVMRARRIVGIL
jgi:hypothetical protein